MDKADLTGTILLSTLFGIPILGGLFLFCVYLFGFCSTLCSCSSHRSKPRPRYETNADTYAALDSDPELDLESGGNGNENGAFHQGVTGCGCVGSGKNGNATSFIEMPLPSDCVHCPAV